MGWKITKDHWHENWIKNHGQAPSSPSLEGKQSQDFDETAANGYRVRTYDDDGELYYEAICSSEETAERFHNWSAADSGTTSSKLKERKQGAKFEHYIG